MQENISISYATQHDCDLLSQVIKDVIVNIPYYNERAKHDEVLKFTALELSKKIEEDAYAVIVAKSENVIVGFCLSRFDDYTIWLEWFGVVQNCRSKGLTYKLLRKLEETVATRKCHKIWCDCRTSNKASIHILTKFGFAQLVTIPNHWYGQDFILWHKQIQ